MPGLSLALPIVGWAAGWMLGGWPPSLRTVAVPAAGGSVSVIIPARNEAVRLPALLAALDAADPPPQEILVVDDGSTDGTADLARAAGARVITVDVPATGWTGKAFACQTGADQATGEVLVFLDADTVPAPSAVARLAAATAGGELVSVQPRHRVGHLYERLSAGPALVTVLGAGIGDPPRHRWWRRAMAFGPALAVGADGYQRIGGHGAVRSSVAEDLELARVATRAGVPVRSFTGDELLGYRMYPEGVRSLVDGWTKNLAAGAGATPPLRLLATVAWVAAVLQVGFTAAAAPGWISLVVYGLFTIQAGVLLRRLGRFGVATAVVYPVLLVVFVALFARSTILTVVRRQVRWRGRAVPLP